MLAGGFHQGWGAWGAWGAGDAMGCLPRSLAFGGCVDIPVAMTRMEKTME